MSIAENLKQIHTKIEKTASAWGRDGAHINLIAVSKRQPLEKLHEALDAGHRLFGENKVQEAYEHWENIKPQYHDLQLHLIGPLQANKTKEAVALFDMIHTLDREKLARKLRKEMAEQGRNIPCLIQVNIGEEEQKSGIAPNELTDFLHFCCNECAINIQGLMCIPPHNEPPAMFFALLHKMAKQHNLPHLSMGMSADYDKAIPLDATYIRVGTAIFGDRTP